MTILCSTKECGLFRYVYMDAMKLCINKGKLMILNFVTVDGIKVKAMEGDLIYWIWSKSREDEKDDGRWR